MALIKCKECGKEISSQAESCPNCGSKKPKPTSVVTWIIAGILVCGVISAISESGKKDEQAAAEAQAKAAKLATMTPEQRAAQAKHDADMAAMKAEVEEASNARYACQEFVKRSLNDPDAAQFDPASGYFIQRQAPDKYRVEVTVRAKNGFNALRHIAVNCVTQKSGENWMPVFVKEITT